MNDRLIAVAKTVSQWLIASLVAWLASKGWAVAPELEEALFVVVLAATTYGVNWLGEKVPWLRVPTAKY